MDVLVVDLYLFRYPLDLCVIRDLCDSNMTQPILLSQDDNGIAVLTFNRPQARNALTLEAMHQFAEKIYRLSNDSSLRVLILTGAGDKAFCSGGDLVELSQRPTADDAQTMMNFMGNALYTMRRLPVPVIAAINGYALGGGSEIALSCDMRIVDETAQMGMVQMKLGLTPGWGGGQRLLHLVGYSKAMEILLKAEVMRPPQLLELGLVNQSTPAGKALDTAMEFAEHIVGLPYQTVKGVKRLLTAGIVKPYMQAMQTERKIFPPLWEAEAHLKAVEDFLARQEAKRKDE